MLLPSLLSPVTQVSWLIRDPVLQLMAEESPAQRLPSLLNCRVSAASQHPLLPKSSIRTEMRKWTKPLSESYRFTQTSLPPNYPTMTRDRQWSPDPYLGQILPSMEPPLKLISCWVLQVQNSPKMLEAHCFQSTVPYQSTNLAQLGFRGSCYFYQPNAHTGP